MSIYSGFATRQLQQTYDQRIGDLMFVMQKRLLKFYHQQQADEDKFYVIFSQLYHQIQQLQKNKYLQPKSSTFVDQIFNYLKQKKQQRSYCPQHELKTFIKSNNSRQKSYMLKLNQIQQKSNNIIATPLAYIGKIKRQIQASKFIEFNQKSQDFQRQIRNQISKYRQNELQQKNPQQQGNYKQQAINRRQQGINRKQDIIDRKASRLFSSQGRKKSQSYQQMRINLTNKLKASQVSNVVHPSSQILKHSLKKSYRKGNPHTKRNINENKNERKSQIIDFKYF